MTRKEFSGEICTNVQPEIMNALCTVNSESVENVVGKDKHSLRASEIMQSYFTKKIYTAYTINGTGANILALKCMTDDCSCIVCSEQSHINTNEDCAVEYNLRRKIIPIDTFDAKLTVERVEKVLIEKRRFKMCPKVLALTQPTELGTLYSVEEIKTLVKYAHDNGMTVYIDGARIAYALTALNTTLKQMIEDTGVDAFSFGGTKVGAMFGEMVVFLKEEFSKNLEYLQKQSMQHLDKSKFLGVQFEYILENKSWQKVAEEGNKNAKKLQEKLLEKGIKAVYPVQTNTVFCKLTDEQVKSVNKEFDVHYWFVTDKIVRFCTTYLTTDKTINTLVDLL